MRATRLGAAMALVAASAAGPTSVEGQSPAGRSFKPLPIESNVAVRLTDGSLVYGKLERMDADSVVIVAVHGRVALGTAAIASVSDAGKARVRNDGTTEYWFPNANTTRLLFGPTGRTLDAGSGYFADHYVVFASASAGLTDRIQLGAGTFIIPNSDFWFVMPKIGVVRSENVNVAVGALYGGVREAHGGIAYAVGTFGGTDHSLTTGVGQGISGDDVEGKPVFMIGGETRMSRRTAFVSENYLGSGLDGGLLMYGVRFLGEKLTVDLGFLNPAKQPVFPGIPYIDFVVRW